MPEELFHPDLPGALAHAEGFRRSGWRGWDELSDEEKAAHEKAVKAAAETEAAESKARTDAWDAAVKAAATAAAKRQAPAPQAPKRSPEKSTTSAPRGGDTTKE